MGAKFSRTKYQYDDNIVPTIGFSHRLHKLDYPSVGWLAQAVPVILETVTNDNLNDIVDDFQNKDRRMYNMLKGNESMQKLLAYKDDQIKKESSKSSESRTIEAYESNFISLPLPNNHQWVYDDDYFAFLRVGGWNPLMLKKVVGNLPSKFPVTEELFRQAPGFENDTISSAIADGRLFIQDYEALTGLEKSSFPHPNFKFIYHPIGLFGLVKGDASHFLKPIAIQGGQEPTKFRVYTPRDGDNWQKMKFAFNSADINYHESISHLGRTHFLMEPFVVATHRLPPNHSLKPLVLAHLEGTAIINYKAVNSLAAPKKILDRLMMGEMSSMIKLSAFHCQNPGFNHLMLRPFLESNGTYDSPLYYPYRDDAILLWDAIRKWMTGFVDAHYQNDLAIQHDIELQSWAALLADVNGGNLKSFGENDEAGKINTKSYLVDVLTMIAFTGGVQHAAVNFPQREMMTFAPICPTAGYKEISDDKINTYAPLEMLPSVDTAEAQIGVLARLGGIYYTRLGYYDEGVLSSLTNDPLKLFHQNLSEIEDIINARNKKVNEKFQYKILLPAKIPQSINI
eukprot:gene15284-20588_t